MRLIDKAKATYCGLSIFAVLCVAEGPLWLIAAALVNAFISAKLANTIERPEEETN